MSREVWVVMDATDSWSGEICAHGVYTSLESARKSICDNPDILAVFMDTNEEGGEINSVSQDVLERLFGEHLDYLWKMYKGRSYISTYDALGALSPEDQEKARNVMYLTIDSCEFYDEN